MLNIRFSALLEGICATLNLRILALKLYRYKVGYSFEGCYFGGIIESVKIVKMNVCKKYPLSCIWWFLGQKDKKLKNVCFFNGKNGKNLSDIK